MNKVPVNASALKALLNLVYEKGTKLRSLSGAEQALDILTDDFNKAVKKHNALISSTEITSIKRSCD